MRCDVSHPAHALLFVKETVLPLPPAVVFAWHERPEALMDLNPPWEPVELVKPGGSLAVGTTVILKGKLGPLPLLIEAEHVEYDPPRLFADRMNRGPFAYWYHRHWFLPVPHPDNPNSDPHAATLMRDEIAYLPPLGGLGRLLSPLIVERRLKRLFDYRHRKVAEALGVVGTPAHHSRGSVE